MADLEAVSASDPNIRFAGKQDHPYRLRRPPKLDELRLGPRLEHDARRAVEGSRNDELTLGLPFHLRAVRRLTSSWVHRLSPSVSVPRQFCPARRSVRPRAGGASRSMPPLPRVRLRPSLQVRTRPTFSVVTSPACSKTPTCFFMPVRVMWNFWAKSVIEASARPSCSRTPRRVASESAANEASKRAGGY